MRLSCQRFIYILQYFKIRRRMLLNLYIVPLVLSLWITAMAVIAECQPRLYHITSGNGLCSTEPCLTLSQFTSNYSHELSNNYSSETVLDMAEGTHALDFSLIILNVNYFSMRRPVPDNVLGTKVHCMKNATLKFHSIFHLSLSNITFIGCIDIKVYHVQSFALNSAQFYGSGNHTSVGTALVLQSTNASLKNVSFRSFHGIMVNSYQRGGAVYCLNSSLVILGSVFHANQAQVGGAIYATRSSTITVKNSEFLQNLCLQNRPGCYGGVMYAANSEVTIFNSSFKQNYARGKGGVFYTTASVITIQLSFFGRNGAVWGGVLHSIKSTVTISHESVFTKNNATSAGGVLLLEGTTLCTMNSSFDHNSCEIYDCIGGGVLFMINCTVEVRNCSFISNEAVAGSGGVFHASKETKLAIATSTFYKSYAVFDGGIIFSKSNTSIEIMDSNLTSSKALTGGTIYAESCVIVSLRNSQVSQSSATENGGALYVQGCGLFEVKESIIDHNGAGRLGGFALVQQTIIKIMEAAFLFNFAEDGGIFLIDNSTFWSKGIISLRNWAWFSVILIRQSTVQFTNNTQFLHNNGSVFLFNCDVDFIGNTTFINDTSLDIAIYYVEFQESGAITGYLSTIGIQGRLVIKSNKAKNGGALFITASRMHIFGSIELSNNTAAHSGGAAYLHQSELRLQGQVIISKNIATKKGGGIHSIASTLVMTQQSSLMPSYFQFLDNTAEMGGALNFEVNSKIYVISDTGQPLVDFSQNSASVGGAIYVADETNLGTCGSDPELQNTVSHECFLQYAAFSTSVFAQNRVAQAISFSENAACDELGSILFGGLLDRCKLTPVGRVYFSTPVDEPHITYGVSFFQEIGKIDDLNNIDSHPVRVCFCNNDHEADCNYQPFTFYVKKGELFHISVTAVNQVNKTVNATIHFSLTSSFSRLGDGQSSQRVESKCTDLEISMYSRNNHEELTLYAEGPCSDIGISRKKLAIIFKPCTCQIGFEPSFRDETKCDCICDSRLSPHITTCHQTTDELVRDSNIWVTFINESTESGFILHPNCPFDYCVSPSPPVNINLAIPGGADAQCAFNRSSTLCGTCKAGLSISLGSSLCVTCRHYWPGLFVALSVAILVGGILLVAFLLMLNLTVSTGTINGLIFYANLVAVNKSTFLPFSQQNPYAIFIAWLNLEFGFDTCFFNGMDTYIKTWLQFGYSFYLFLIAVVIIIISERSTKFSRLISGKNPVGTLATLIWLSYTKFLQNVITALQFAILYHPDGSKEVVWLADATIGYVSGKHIPLFITALLIIIVGFAYTVLLFTWQWLLKIKRKHWYNAWINSTRVHSFMDAYHGPYSFKHRYWTGLLLFVRILLYIIASVNVSGEPSINLLAVSICITCLLLLKGGLNARIYKACCLDVLELSWYFNIAIFCVARLMNLASQRNETVTAFISLTIALLMFALITGYHMITEIQKKIQAKRSVQTNYNDYILHENSVNNEQNLVEPNKVTYSVVELSTTAGDEIEG